MARRAVTDARGIALLSVMIVVASVSATASWLLYSQNLDIERTSRILKKEQAVLLALTIESRALVALQRDRVRDGDAAVDYYARAKEEEDDDAAVAADGDDDGDDESWSRPWRVSSAAPPLESLGDARISMCIYDLHGLLNVNNLRAVSRLRPPPENEDRHDERNPVNPGVWHARRFRKFIQKFAVTVPVAEEGSQPDVNVLMDSLGDWLDGDDNFRTSGAEDAEYSLKKFGYHAANAAMVSPRELHWVKGFEDLPLESLASLRSRLAALPARIVGRSSKLNVNTATAEVLETLPYFDADIARKVRERVREEPLTAQNEIAEVIRPLLPPRDDQQPHLLDWVDEYLTVQSRFFGLVVAVSFSGVELTFNSLLYRDNTDPPYRVYVLQRHFGKNPYAGLEVFDGGRCVADGGDARTPQQERE